MPADLLAETFDHNYLDALSREGIDLPQFLQRWQLSMNEDLNRLDGLRKGNDVQGLHTSLHRLSGSAGMVGARDLTQALQDIGTSKTIPETHALDQLIQRARTLMKQLDAVRELHRSNVR